MFFLVIQPLRYINIYNISDDDDNNNDGVLERKKKERWIFYHTDDEKLDRSCNVQLIADARSI